MKELLEFLLDGIVGKDNYKISEKKVEERLLLGLKVPEENMGLIIGKGGRMIKSVRNLLKVRATLEKTAVNLEIEE